MLSDSLPGPEGGASWITALLGVRGPEQGRARGEGRGARGDLSRLRSLGPVGTKWFGPLHRTLLTCWPSPLLPRLFLGVFIRKIALDFKFVKAQDLALLTCIAQHDTRNYVETALSKWFLKVTDGDVSRQKCPGHTPSSTRRSRRPRGPVQAPPSVPGRCLAHSAVGKPSLLAW